VDGFCHRAREVTAREVTWLSRPSKESRSAFEVAFQRSCPECTDGNAFRYF
jgi:hypothetical protein